MSKSYKKNPIHTDRPNGAKYWKRVANKKVRKQWDNFKKGKKYRRIYNPYEIHDYISYWDKFQALNYYENGGFWRNGEWIPSFDYKTRKEFLDKYWKKYWRRK